MDPTFLNQCALRIKELKSQGLSDRRRQAEENKIIVQIYAVMRKTVTMMVNRKGMSAFLEDAEQQAHLAIYRACHTFDPSMSSFSTYAHWQIRAELKSLELTMLPERRKIKLQNPFSIFSLSMPAHIANGENGDTAESMLVDDQSESNTERGAMVHIALSSMDRLFSHYISRKYHLFCSGDPAADAREREITKHMRNRDIYYRNRIIGQKYNDIGDIYGITRERIRQIIQKMDKDLEGYFPIIDKDKKTIIPSTKLAPVTMGDYWEEITEIYSHLTPDEEVCLVKRYHADMAAPGMTREQIADKRRKQRVTVEETISVESGAQDIIETPTEKIHVEKTNSEEVRRQLSAIRPLNQQIGQTSLFSEMDLPHVAAQRKTLKRVAGSAMIIGAMAMANQAAAQQSHAIPPTDKVIVSNDDAVVHNSKIDKGENVAVWRMGKISPNIKTGRKILWVAKVAEFDSISEVAAHKNEVRAAHPELARLKAAVIPGRPGKRPGLGFGPLDRRAADRTCQALKNKGVSCILVRLRS